MVASNKVPFDKKGFRYFTGHENGKKIRPLCIMLPKMSAYRRYFDETKYMSKYKLKINIFLIKVMNC